MADVSKSIRLNSPENTPSSISVCLLDCLNLKSLLNSCILQVNVLTPDPLHHPLSSLRPAGTQGSVVFHALTSRNTSNLTIMGMDLVVVFSPVFSAGVGR